MITMKLVLGVMLIGTWVWFMGCLAPDNTAKMIQRAPQKIYDVAHEVAPGHAHLLLEQVSEENGTRTYDLMLADYLVGRPVGQGMRFSLEEKQDGVFASAITEVEMMPVKSTATPIRILHVRDRTAAEQALPPTVRVPATVAVLSVLNKQCVEVTFWYRDVAGQVREGKTTIAPQLNAFTSWTENLRFLNLLWTMPTDVLYVGTDVVTVGVFVAALPLLIFVK